MIMKSHYCSRCEHPFEKLYNCKYEEHQKEWFLLCYNCVLECKQIYKKTFRSQIENVTPIRFIKTGKQRSKYWLRKKG